VYVWWIDVTRDEGTACMRLQVDKREREREEEEAHIGLLVARRDCVMDGCICSDHRGRGSGLR